MIIADEPTGNLDPATAWEIMQLFLRINARGATFVMATHNREIVDLLRRRVIAIDSGQIARDDRSRRSHEDVAKPQVRVQWPLAALLPEPGRAAGRGAVHHHHP